jgi:small-conductance mechanosensitive channel
VTRLRFLGRAICSACLVASAIAASTGPPSPTTPPGALPLPPEQAVNYVSRTIAWYRRIAALQQLPVDSDDVVPRERAYQGAVTAAQLAFDFGHAAAKLAAGKPAGADSAKPAGGDNAKPAAGGNAASNSQEAQNQLTSVDQAAARMDARVADLQAQLSAIDDQLARARGKERETLAAKRGEISAELDLTKEMQNTIAQIERFEDISEAHSGGAAGGLAGQIDDLQKTVPELRVADRGTRGLGAQGGGGLQGNGGAQGTGAQSSGGGAQSGSGGPGGGGQGNGSAQGGGGGPGGSGGHSGGGGSGSSQTPAAPATAAPAAAVNTQTFRPESAGVIALLGKWFSLASSQRQLADGLKQTEGLQKDLGSVRGAITKEARGLAQQNVEATNADPAQLLQSKLKFQEAANRFRQLSTLLVPLGEQDVTLDAVHSTLDEWRDSLGTRVANIARYLGLRMVFLLGSVGIVLLISDVWRRATFRYLQDTRRRQQFLALRRVAVGVALAIVIAFGLVSEVGSLATYAGLITAGLAVALQNVILAIVAYFFFIGRYGVRVGDRITIGGVTGRVVEIGLVRIYLLELVGPQLRSTGRMVVLSNAVLFQPTALFKQMPGCDYAWHTIMLILAPTTEVAEVEKRLREAAESIYAKYRSAIEERHAELQRFIDFQTTMPAPEVYARLTTKGLECTVRYPVDPSQAAVTDQRMLTAVREAQLKDPPLQLVDGPVLDSEA